MTNADLPAMPCQPLGQDGLPSWEMAHGLTKREMFAMSAMQGLCAHSGDYHTFEDLISDAVNYADALLEALEQAK